MKRLIIISTLIVIAIIPFVFNTKNAIASPVMAMVTPGECDEYCYPAPAECPAMHCDSPYELDMDCYNSACSEYMDSVAACNATACEQCVNEHDRHQEAIRIMEAKVHICESNCNPHDEACINACYHTYGERMLSEFETHYAIMHAIAYNYFNCRLDALNRFAQYDCCRPPEQH